MDNTITARLEEKKNNPIERYREYGYYQFSDDGEGFNLRESRDNLHKLGKGTDTTVQEIDEVVIEAAVVNDYVADYLLKDDNAQPLPHWWWHLGKIRDKSYPAELLPAHLQAVYGEGGAVAAA